MLSFQFFKLVYTRYNCYVTFGTEIELVPGGYFLFLLKKRWQSTIATHVYMFVLLQANNHHSQGIFLLMYVDSSI